MESNDQPTCGKGLAEHAAVPAKIAELIAALADNLALHQNTLDVSDENARKEHEAYVILTNEYRNIASQLHATASRVAGYRDLPMGRHDEQAMSDPKLVDAFVKFVNIEHELFALLQTAARRDQKMVDDVQRPGDIGK